MLYVINDFFENILNAGDLITYISNIYWYFYDEFSSLGLGQADVIELSSSITSIQYLIFIVLSFLLVYNIIKICFKGVLKICGLI